MSSSKKIETASNLDVKTPDIIIIENKNKKQSRL